MSESAYVSCPFCGECFHGFADRAQAEHPPFPIECPLAMRILRLDQWNMRPPRKEQPAMPVGQSEVVWLRMLAERFIDMKVVNITLPTGVKVSEGK